MPNHITNRLRFDADYKKVKEILEKIKQDEFGVGSIDFNKIIPMPNDIFRGNLGSAEREIYRDSNMISWRVDNWNSKYNSYGYECMTQPFEGNEITFLTAWSAPTPVIQKLSEMFPDVEIEHLWADEDFGYNCGAVTWRGGEQIFLDIPTGGTKEAYELAAEIMDYDLADCGLYLNADESNYIYLDSDEYELIEFFGEPALFTNNKISESDIPKGLFCYHLRESANSDGFSTVEPYVKVNHGGSVITKTPLEFGEQGYFQFDEETSPNFLGEHVKIMDYMENCFEQEGGISLEYLGTEDCYQKANFDTHEHEKLFEFMFDEVHKKYSGKCKFIITYNNHPSLIALADKYGFPYRIIPRLHNMQQSTNPGAIFEELVITNYDWKAQMIENCGCDPLESQQISLFDDYTPFYLNN